MSVEEFARSIDFLVDQVFPRMLAGRRGGHLTVEYLGGEILLVPEAELAENVSYARKRLSGIFNVVRDGAQSNLQASPRRIDALNRLFSGNIGTSTDGGTGQRRIKGSSKLYHAFLEKASKQLTGLNTTPPGRAIVIDQQSIPVLPDEIRRARVAGYDLVMQPVFEGGTETVSVLDVDTLSQAFDAAYDAWSEDPEHWVDPFSGLFLRRISRGRTDPRGQSRASAFTSCPFQSDCAFKSIALDPDGRLFVCQQMADSGQYPLGNALEEHFDEKTWRLLARRSLHLSDSCSRCPWVSECGGGCMKEAIAAHGDPFAKTEYCGAWKTIFRRIENDISAGRIPDRLNRMAQGDPG